MSRENRFPIDPFRDRCGHVHVHTRAVGPTRSVIYYAIADADDAGGFVLITQPYREKTDVTRSRVARLVINACKTHYHNNIVTEHGALRLLHHETS